MAHKIQTKEQLEDFVINNWNEVNIYFNSVDSELELPFYTSVDIRESLHNFAPIDNNLYPAGFNNICMLDLNLTAQRIKDFIASESPQAKVIGILCESHTKNKFYLNHLAQLKILVESSNLIAKIISFDTTLFEGKNQVELVSENETSLTIFKAEIQNDKIFSKEEIDFVILNNDQSNPIDIAWKEIKTPVHPSAQMGWNNRQKITHFEHYKEVADKFCLNFDINPNLIQARFKSVHDIDFQTKEGLETLASAVDELKSELLPEQKIFVKASQGTYGMGIMTVDSGEEILNMNRKKRNKMDVGKNKIKFTSAIVQEGIETVLTHNSHPAEITIYLIGGKSVGGFLRTNPERTSTGNLNSKGVIYQKFCISEIDEGHDHKSKEAIYSVIARLSTIAAGHEIKNISEKI